MVFTVETLQLPSDPFLSLFVACCNERANIVGTLCAVRDACTEVEISYEILVIDDASTDDSVEIIRAWMAEHPTVPIRLIRNAVNQGLAKNFITGAGLANGEWYRLICGDNVEPKETLSAIFRRIGQVDVLLPYHVCCPGKVWTRKIISWCYTWAVNILSGHRIRYYNGLPVARREHAGMLCSPKLGFGFQADYVTQLLDLDLSWLEIGVQTYERRNGVAKAFTMKNFLGVSMLFRRLLRRRLKRLIFRVKPTLDEIAIKNLPET